MTKSWVNPFTKIPKMATFEIGISKEEILFMKIEHHRKRFQGFFCRKMKKEKISISWLNPFTKIPQMATFKIDIYNAKEPFY